MLPMDNDFDQKALALVLLDVGGSLFLSILIYQASYQIFVGMMRANRISLDGLFGTFFFLKHVQFFRTSNSPLS